MALGLCYGVVGTARVAGPEREVMAQGGGFSPPEAAAAVSEH